VDESREQTKTNSEQGNDDVPMISLQFCWSEMMLRRHAYFPPTGELQESFNH
jgi:hypothetical protein